MSSGLRSWNCVLNVLYAIKNQIGLDKENDLNHNSDLC